ncbi:alkene reductase [Nocardiopsis changdeensis]|uniref:Alkene reductase n=1 Tax=Nocardiopsis changdeensis TaxID=2831969 RepID=A0ABX8BKS2_9ACTN|nr:alkene reductase [Nocardiopsis changdeensis]QUX21403.1 alkene reductase [Nocardiopsis changdeensis]QYX37335.1 alkene reductase [Nocardiopsis sp. MT53]
MDDSLFQPIKVGRHEAANRLFMAPMTRSRCYAEGRPDALVAEYYGQRASSGLIITEGIQPSVRGQGYINTPGLHDAGQVEAWKPVTDAVHARGSLVFAQLMHTGRIGHPVLYPDGGLPVAPSPIASGQELFDGSGMLPHPEPRELTVAEIQEVVDDFANAARNAVEAGFDGVEVHGANGYLVHQFLADGSNHRTDEYGGDAERRSRFAIEVVDAIADTIGADRTALRISPENNYNGMSDGDPAAQYTALLEGLRHRSDLAFLHTTQIGGAELTPLVRRLWEGTLVVNPATGLDLTGVDAALANGADAVALGSAWLANPDLDERLRSGADLNAPDAATFYGGDRTGYTDYPHLAGA